MYDRVSANVHRDVLRASSAVEKEQVPGLEILRIGDDVVAIGVSTGGPGALMDLIPRFPADFPVPILIVWLFLTIVVPLSSISSPSA